MNFTPGASSRFRASDPEGPTLFRTQCLLPYALPMRKSLYPLATKDIAALVLCCVIGAIASRTHGVDLQTVWSTNYPMGRAASMALDAAGNMYVTGGSPTTNRYPGTLILKIDRQGQVLWQALYQSVTNGDTPVQLLLDAETNVYVLGYSWAENVGNTDSFLLKYSPEGVPLWQRSRGAPYT